MAWVESAVDVYWAVEVVQVCDWLCDGCVGVLQVCDWLC